jgi:hypothetical protein
MNDGFPSRHYENWKATLKFRFWPNVTGRSDAVTARKRLEGDTQVWPTTRRIGNRFLSGAIFNQ